MFLLVISSAARNLSILRKALLQTNHNLKLVPRDLPMQQDVLAIFIYFNDRIAPAEVRIQISKTVRYLTGLPQGNLNYPSVYLPRARKRKHDTARVDCLTRMNICLLSPFAETAARHSCGKLNLPAVKCQQVSKCQPVGSCPSSLVSGFASNISLFSRTSGVIRNIS